MYKIINTSKNDCSLLFSKDNKDFSSKDFINCKLTNDEEKDFDNSFFKGCIFKNVQIYNANFRHVEFDESSFSNDSYFRNCDFKSSDFIYNDIENIIFENCSFQNGEWREVVLKNVKFINCNFNSTTINLCKFMKCDFDEESSKSFEGNSKTFNIFFQTELNLSDIKLLETNFGLRGQNKLSIEIDQNDKSPFFEMALLYYSNQLTNAIFINKILEILTYFSTIETRNFQAKIKFVSNIIINLVQNNFSIIQMQYLYQKLLLGMQTINNQLFLLEIIKIITSLGMEINKKINMIDTYINSIKVIEKEQYNLEFKFDNTYTKEEMENFLFSLSVILDVPKESIKILSYKKGSTLLKIATFSITFSILLKSINYFLPDLTLAVKNSHELYREFKEFDKTIEIYQEKEIIIKSLEKVNINNINNIMKNTNNKDFLFIEGKVFLAIS